MNRQSDRQKFMRTDPAAMEPLLPVQVADLADLALKITAEAGALEGMLTPQLHTELRELLRITNSYYSNLIEDHNTRPIDIYRAMAADYSADPERRDLQIESRVHIETQKWMEAYLSECPDTQITSVDFLRQLHRRFYEHCPASFRSIEHNGELIELIPGEIRDRDVEVGRHIAPSHESLDRFMKRFEAFEDTKQAGHMKLIAAAASHHRLAWIHPFLDGNGRVTRLFSEAYLLRVMPRGYGLWSVSRGLARDRERYKEMLALADSPRQGDYDGRGNLSEKGLASFCKFYLDTMLDQISYMRKQLALETVQARITHYFGQREAGVLDEPPLKAGSADIVLYVWARGQVARGDIYRILGVSERTARDMLKGLIEDGILGSQSAKGDVFIKLPHHFVQALFPNLFPPY